MFLKKQVQSSTPAKLMREVVQQLLDSIQSGSPTAYCRLVETRGSTPQKAGAMMLVFPDGSQAGTLGGGCVEAEIKRRALAVLERGQPEIVKLQLDSDYGWDDGLICGGRMQTLIEPLTDSDPAVRAYYLQLCELLLEGKGVTEAVVFDDQPNGQSNGLSAPSSYLFDSEDVYRNSLRAAVDTKEPPSQILQQLRPLASRPRAYAAQGVSFLPSTPRCRLVIVGAGHVGQAVAKIAADLDFDVWALDDREEFVTAERFPRAERRITGQFREVLPSLEITPDTYCLIITRGHNHDEEALYHLAERGARYIGMIGSKRKIKLIFDDLLNEGISVEALEKVYAPLGVNIGSQTVPEIALSICAELVAHRNCGGEVPGRPNPIPVGDRE